MVFLRSLPATRGGLTKSRGNKVNRRLHHKSTCRKTENARARKPHQPKWNRCERRPRGTHLYKPIGKNLQILVSWDNTNTNTNTNRQNRGLRPTTPSPQPLACAPPRLPLYFHHFGESLGLNPKGTAALSLLPQVSKSTYRQRMPYAVKIGVYNTPARQIKRLAGRRPS